MTKKKSKADKKKAKEEKKKKKNKKLQDKAKKAKKGKGKKAKGKPKAKATAKEMARGAPPLAVTRFGGEEVTESSICVFGIITPLNQHCLK